jgi:hypothetical protein
MTTLHLLIGIFALIVFGACIGWFSRGYFERIDRMLIYDGPEDEDHDMLEYKWLATLSVKRSKDTFLSQLT